MNKLDGKSILIIDDDEGIRVALRKLFNRHGAEVSLLSSGTAAAEELHKSSHDAVVLDVRLQESESGIDVLKLIRSIDQFVPVVMITGYGTVTLAVEAMKLGAADFILKPIDNEALLEIIAKNISISSLRNENAWLRQELRAQHYPTDSFITRNPQMLEMLRKADKIKNSSATILVTGESGTGKEVFAQYIHYTSVYSAGPFVGLNCAALDEHLLLSELFGHEKGAFTGAHERKIGKLELAHKGTLFLDEIGDMSLSVQAKVLRVLEQRSFERVGGSRTIHTEFRLITATNRNLEALLREKRFREDLYYRIRVMAFHLMPLRERPEDVEPIAEAFIAFFAKRYGKEILPAGTQFFENLQHHCWPGNVRELRNVINQMVLLSEDGRLLHDDICFDRAYGDDEGVGEDNPDWDKGFDLLYFLERKCDHYESRLLKKALAVYRGNKSEIARKLHITRKTLARKLERHGLE
jgi:DNA-binding NtrC family response regulator